MTPKQTIYCSNARGAFYDAEAIERLDAECIRVTAQRDELLAAAKDVIDQWPGEANAFPQLERAIAKAEIRGEPTRTQPRM